MQSTPVNRLKADLQVVDAGFGGRVGCRLSIADAARE
jgi:hypothetical protein